MSTDVRETTARYVAAMNSGDLEGILELYADGAVSAWDPQNPVTGEAHTETVSEFLELNPRMTAQVRESYVTNDTALLVVDWTIDVDGEPEHFSGVGTDVLRLCDDGNWRYMIDSPYGESS